MKQAFSLLFSIIITLNVSAQDKSAYAIFDAKGKKMNYSKMMKQLPAGNIILFGELHNNAISHWLQLEVTKDLHQSNKMVLGAEMFERDDAETLEAYVKGELAKEAFDTLARFWKNYKTDYAPLVEFAKENKLAFIGTNIPRRYANMVYKGGFEALDTLSDEEKSWMAPMPIDFDPELPTYQEILSMMGDHGSPDLVKAQAMKDATMAYFIMQNYNEGQTFIHYNGAFHSNKYEGILWYLKKANADLNYITISTVSQDDLSKLEVENKGLADFIICVDSDMTETY